MMSQNLEQQLLELPLDEQLQIVQSVLASIQQKARVRHPTTPEVAIDRPLHPWTQSLIGVIKDDGKDDTETYIDYLEEKYRSSPNSSSSLRWLALQAK
jgi:hypothetical protein